MVVLLDSGDGSTQNLRGNYHEKLGVIRNLVHCLGEC
jgi:hypothetical protein